MTKDLMFLEIVNAKTRSEREAVVKKYGKMPVGRVLLKLKYIKKEIEEDNARRERLISLLVKNKRSEINPMQYNYEIRELANR